MEGEVKKIKTRLVFYFIFVLRNKNEKFIRLQYCAHSLCSRHSFFIFLKSK